MPTYRHDHYPPASLFKQFAAMIYDSFLILAILFVAVGITIPFNQGIAIKPSLVYGFLIIVIFIFYGWFWNRSGQTLGMRTWKIQIVSEFGGYPSWNVSFLRLVFAMFSFACFGLGYWWRLFKPYTWHDKFSQTKVIDISNIAVDKDSVDSD
jgi:uncharacterized RDD family membrane protein YckC